MKGVKHLFIYVLECANQKYYVGKSIRIPNRLFEHAQGEGSEWTKKHAPERLVELFHGDVWDEDKTTKRYMSKYGIDNVRGGSYVSRILTDKQIKSLKVEIRTAENRCFICGSDRHFAKHCQK